MWRNLIDDILIGGANSQFPRGPVRGVSKAILVHISQEILFYSNTSKYVHCQSLFLVQERLLEPIQVPGMTWLYRSKKATEKYTVDNHTEMARTVPKRECTP